MTKILVQFTPCLKSAQPDVCPAKYSGHIWGDLLSLYFMLEYRDWKIRQDITRHDTCHDTARHDMCHDTTRHDMCHDTARHDMCHDTARHDMCHDTTKHNKARQNKLTIMFGDF